MESNIRITSKKDGISTIKIFNGTTIKFRNRNYRIRYVLFPDGFTRLIAEDRLNKRLFGDDGYVSTDAKCLDEAIYGFASSEEFESLSDEELCKLFD